MGKQPKTQLNKKTVIAATILAIGVGSIVLSGGVANAASVNDWDRIAACEAGDMHVLGSAQWYRSDGDADSTGGLQIQTRTWNEYKSGVSTASEAYQATKQQQILVAEKILADRNQGYAQAWVCNNSGHGIASNALSSVYGAPNTSMYRGGLNPYAATPNPTPAPKPVPTPTPVPTPKPKPTTAGKYVVRSGDTLGSIATTQGVSGGWKALYEANKAVIGSNPNLIYPGQVLKVPAKTYTVKTGDSLSSIAIAQNVKGGWSALYSANRTVIGGDPDLILPGQMLTIPNGGSSIVVVPKPATPKPSTPSNSQGYSPPLAKGSYSLGDGLIVGSGGSMSRSYGGHSGQDMTAPVGTPVKAVANGVIIAAGRGYADTGGEYGIHIVIRHDDGKYSLYAHLSSTNVSVGQRVSAGNMIGRVGVTGNTSGAHLHFEVRLDPKAFNSSIFLSPVAYLRSHGVSL